MRIAEQLRPFLDGREFSNGLRVPIVDESSKRVQDRLSWLEAAAVGKHVIHVGCVDHLPLIPEKRARGRWLHERLCQTSARCFGVDVHAEGIRYVREELGYEDVVCADIAGETVPALQSSTWDTMILGELVEHLDDPVRFLHAVRERYVDVCRTLLVSAPNALRWENTSGALRGLELINTDHRCWFSPYTLAKLLTVAGFTVRSFALVTGHPIRVRGPRSARRKLMLSLFPAFRDTVIAEAGFEP